MTSDSSPTALAPILQLPRLGILFGIGNGHEIDALKGTFLVDSLMLCYLVPT